MKIHPEVSRPLTHCVIEYIGMVFAEDIQIKKAIFDKDSFKLASRVSVGETLGEKMW